MVPPCHWRDELELQIEVIISLWCLVFVVSYYIFRWVTRISRFLYDRFGVFRIDEIGSLPTFVIINIYKSFIDDVVILVSSKYVFHGKHIQAATLPLSYYPPPHPCTFLYSFKLNYQAYPILGCKLTDFLEHLKFSLLQLDR